jgi:hypothetical protein
MYNKIFLGKEVEKLRSMTKKDNQCSIYVKGEKVRVNKLNEKMYNVNGKKYILERKELIPV